MAVQNYTDAFAGLPFESRQCRFENENRDPKSVFKEYTQEGCMFECALRRSTTRCGCIPWDYPQLGSHEDIELCYGSLSKCFDTEMNKPVIQNENCTCPQSCKGKTVTTQVNSFGFDVCTHQYAGPVLRSLR